jgi:hypothetical protein
MGNHRLTGVQEASSNRESHPSVRADAERFANRSLRCCRPRAIVRPKDAAWKIAPSQHPPDDRLVEAEIVAMDRHLQDRTLAQEAFMRDKSRLTAPNLFHMFRIFTATPSAGTLWTSSLFKGWLVQRPRCLVGQLRAKNGSCAPCVLLLPSAKDNSPGIPNTASEDNVLLL